MKRPIALMTVVGMTLLAMFGAGGPVHAVVPGANGRILFARCVARPKVCFDRKSTVKSWEIVAADPDDTNETVLAGPYPRSVWDDHFIANWAPDGKTVIFVGRQAIWQVNADGTGLRRVFVAPAGTFLDDGPAFTPDGTHIIFTRCCGHKTLGYSLWEIDAEGTGLHHVTNEYFGPKVDGPSDNLPQVSPDGALIAFSRNICRDPSDCGNRIVTVNIHGGHRVELTVTDPALLGPADSANWSPDGKRIVITIGPFTGNIGTVNRDGSGFTQLTFNAPDGGASLDPSWSPDGTKIIFHHCPSTWARAGSGSGFCDLFTMSPDGSGVTQITKTATGEFWPQWAVANP